MTDESIALTACKWLIEYHEGPGPIVTLEEYLSRAKAAVNAQNCSEEP